MKKETQYSHRSSKEKKGRDVNRETFFIKNLSPEGKRYSSLDTLLFW